MHRPRRWRFLITKRSHAMHSQQRPSSRTLTGTLPVKRSPCLQRLGLDPVAAAAPLSPGLGRQTMSGKSHGDRGVSATGAARIKFPYLAAASDESHAGKALHENCSAGRILNASWNENSRMRWSRVREPPGRAPGIP